MIAAKNVAERHLRVDKGAEEFEKTWRRNKRKSDLRHTRGAAALRAAAANITTATAWEESRIEVVGIVSRIIRG